jgi:hypothetical protein
LRERALLLPLRASQRKAPAQHGRRRAGKPVFAYAGREGRSFNATRGTACGDWRPRRAALDARSEHLLPCRATAARACVSGRAAIHGTCYRRLRYGAMQEEVRTWSRQHGIQHRAYLNHQWRRRACATMLPSPSTVNVAMAWRYDSRPHACQPWQHLFAAEIEGQWVPGTAHTNRVLMLILAGSSN